MTTIDEIMGAIGRHGNDCIRDADAASESFDGLREMIAAALADARREGAEEMREAAGDAAQRAAGRGLSASAVHLCIRALPLPTGSQPAVLLTDEQIEDALCRPTASPSWLLGSARAIEAAALAANGLEVRNAF